MARGLDRKVFFLDRDGAINVDHGYVSKIEDFTFIDGIFPVLRALEAKGYGLIVVTNQSGIGRGYYTEGDFYRVTEWMLGQLEAEGVHLIAVYHCPHSPEADCACRKPAPGMFLQAICEHGVDPALSWMVGDKPSDMEAAASAGICNRVLLGGAVSGHSTHQIVKLGELLDLPL